MRSRTLPSEGTKMRLIRMMEKRYYFNAKDVGLWLRKSEQSGRLYIKQLIDDGVIELSHKESGLHFYRMVK
jgi:hypothetical protein